tara:strand:+ start:2058 stop:3509 length:1452 start_codon:yes stop_codon:yes gene_type:complete
MKLINLTATEIIKGFANNNFSALDLAGELCKQVDKYSFLNALINFDPEIFLKLAQRSDDVRKKGGTIGSLEGVPVVVKDNIDVIGFKTTAANAALRRQSPSSNGPVIQALLDAGAIVMAKSNMHELAFSPGITNNMPDQEWKYGFFGNALNPYNTKHSPAGSSSGTGAAIASRMVPVGLGSDTGGSIRNPAAWCGISGLRPTINRYSQISVVPISWTRDTLGPMARSVEDLILLDGVITGELERPAVKIKELRLGINYEYFCLDADPQVLSLFERELSRLEGEGAAIIPVEIPNLEELIQETGHSISIYEIVRAIPRYLEEGCSKVRFDEIIAEISASGLQSTLLSMQEESAITSKSYNHSIKNVRPRLQKVYRDCFLKHNLDALVFPSSLIQPFELQNPGQHRYKGREISAFAASGHNVQPASLCGCPGLTVAAGLSESGLPIGIGFDGLHGSDRKLLSIGMAYENVRPAIPIPELILEKCS